MSVTDLRNTGSVEEILEWCASLPPETENQANGLMKRMCDRWSLHVLGANGPVRFAALGRRLNTITQKVLTRTLRSPEHDCLITRTVYPEVARSQHSMHPEFCACQLAKCISPKADTDQQKANRANSFI